MLRDSQQVRVTRDDGIATVWLGYAAAPLNGLSAARLAALSAAVAELSGTPSVEIAVIRSGWPGGFCEGFDPTAYRREVADPAGFARAGQAAFAQLADAPFVSLAFLEGPCLGPGLELALACDYRLAVSGPDAWYGFGDLPTCWGGWTRLSLLAGGATAERFTRETVTAREAKALGAVDRVCCERRKKIDLQTWLDELREAPDKRRRPWRGWFRDLRVGFADERRSFHRAVESLPESTPRPAPLSVNPLQPLRSVGLIGDSPAFAGRAVEWALRGVNVAWVGDRPPCFADAIRRGRATPLEASQAAARIRVGADAAAVLDCDLVLLDGPAAAMAAMLERELRPRAVLGLPAAQAVRVAARASRPARVVGFDQEGAAATLTPLRGTAGDTLASAAAWLEGAGTVVALAKPRAAARRLQVA